MGDYALLKTGCYIFPTIQIVGCIALILLYRPMVIVELFTLNKMYYFVNMNFNVTVIALLFLLFSGSNKVLP